MYSDLQGTVPSSAPLGQKSPYPKGYDKTLLQPIARSMQRHAMKLATNLTMCGFDVWNAYELFWLDMNGKPVRAFASFLVPSSSLYLCESKSVKLYLNSLNHEKFLSHDDAMTRIKNDLSEFCQAPVDVRLRPSELALFDGHINTNYRCLDDLDVAITAYQRDPSLLKVGTTQRLGERVVSHLFKSHCLCTGQPDLGSIFIEYSGRHIDEASLLQYLLSYRDHAGFSENCIEQIFADISELASPEKLVVFGRFTRRGGIDINPYRATHEIPFHNARLVYQ